MTWNKFFQKVLLLFCIITMTILFISIRTTKNINRRPATTTNNALQYLRYNTTKQFKSVSGKDAVDKFRTPFKKIFIVFTYWEQLTAATNNFLNLTALAAFDGRQVVVPFVKDSFFLGSLTKRGFETLANVYSENTAETFGQITLLGLNYD